MNNNDIQIGFHIAYDNDIDHPRIVLDIRHTKELELIVAPLSDTSKVSLWITSKGWRKIIK